MNVDYFNRLIDVIKKEDVDAIFITPSEEMKFLLGHSPSMGERFQGVFIKENGEYFYICNKLTVDEMENLFDDNKDKVYGWFDNDGFIDIVEKVLEKENLIGKKIGVNCTARAFNILEIMDKIDVKFVNTKKIIEDWRIIKSPEEINNLRIAAKKADIVYKKIIKFIKPGIKEQDIIDKIAELFLEEGCEISFDTIVASGVNSSQPHYNSGTRVIEEKDMMVLDFGCKYNGFCSDMSRTVFVGGISEEEKKIYEIVLASNAAGENAVKLNAKVADVDKAARKVIEDAGYGDYFYTRLGHGIGYSVHEAPDIKQSSDRKLDVGMAFSIEPGIYLPGKFGMRVEDILVITEKGPEILNKSERGIVIV